MSRCNTSSRALRGARDWQYYQTCIFPFHNPTALTLALQIVSVAKPDAVILNGDIFDFHGVSKFGKPPERKSGFKYEIYAGRRLFKMLCAALPEGVPIIYNEGNHEYRLQSWLMWRGPEMFDLDVLRMESLLKFPPQVKYQWRSDIPLGLDHHVVAEVKAGHLYITHGDQFRGANSTINTARMLFLRLQVSMIVGHFHRNSFWFQTDYEGKPRGFWVAGCLALPRSDYNASYIADHAVMIADVFWPSGFFQVTPVTLMPENGEYFAVLDGVRYVMPRHAPRDFPDVREIWRGVGCKNEEFTFEAF